jgi:hypothetical protein
VIHKKSSRFSANFEKLPRKIQNLARKSFSLLKENPTHPSLHFKKVGHFWSIRIGLHHRALAVKQSEAFIWVWIGTHDDYMVMIKKNC